MKTGNLEWSYRLGIRPGPYAHTEIEKAVRYALDAGMTDICLFLNGEEMNTGFFTDEELTACLDIAARLKTALAGTALTLSVNPWNTLLHGDRGRQLKAGQSFRTMVDVNGKAAEAVACPLCENWRQWLLGAYTKIAKAVRPNIIWVEDDFRLHNHDGLEWGGCFCEAHMAAYSRRLGLETPVGRADFLARVTDAEPNAYRMAWLDTHRDTMNELAALLENAVHSVSPETRLALMSSLPAQHCAEGRDWHGILNALAGGHKPINRIHLPAYAETWPAEYMRGFSTISLCVRAMCPADTQVLPELENYPYSRFIKSRAFTRFQVESAAPLNLAGMTLDLFDIMGGGLMPGEGYQDVLPQSFEFIARMNETGAFGAAHAGVCVPVSSWASYHLHARGGGMPGLYPRETFLGGLLGTLGVPVYYLADAIPQNTISAVSGQWLRNLTKDEIEHFFATNRVLLDGEAAADTLFRLGLGHLAGIRAVCWHRQDSGTANYEQAESPYLGLPEAACSSQIMAGDYLQIDYEDGKAHYRAKLIMDLFAEDFPNNTAVPSYLMKEKAGFGKGGEKGFEGTLQSLQAQTYLVNTGFTRKQNRKGEAYGWSISVYEPPESLFGEEYVRSEYSLPPEESFKKIINRMKELYPDADERDILKEIK